MSTVKDLRKCQKAVTLLQETVNDFWINHHTLDHLKLNVTNSLLPLLAASLTKHQDSLAIVTPQLKAGGQLLNSLTKWQNFISPNHTWHLISGKLAAHEIEGLVTTSLRTAITSLLKTSPRHHYIIPIDLLDSNIPNPQTYQQSQLSIHTGQRLNLSNLTKQLTTLGYTRQASSLDYFTFRVQGESLLVQDNTSITHQITFFGDTIETITRRSTRGTRITSLLIPPAILPLADTPLLSALDGFTILHPNFPDLTSHPRQITINALNPDLDFPWSQAPQLNLSNPTIIFYQNHDRVAAYASQRQISHPILCRSDIATLPISLSSPQLNITTEATLIPQTLRPPVSPAAGLALMSELTPNKPAVHADHGIGIFEGLTHRTIDGSEREYLILRYAAGDTLSVPVEYAHKITAYLGHTAPPINRLGSPTWNKSKSQATQDAARFAQELIRLSSRRQQSTDRSLYLDPQIEQQLDDSFPYQLTPDQASAWESIKADLSSTQPLDRLVVGDVGFGKTELAVRTARHAVNNGYQVAILAPTTLLVQQHAATFAARLPELTDRIKVLSRFATPSEQSQTRQAINDHQADIVIGTHALLSSRTTWAKLGLVVIDEEQRFGVKQKSHFKKIRAHVDLLSLSATPIPRTLSMALSGLTNLSVISSAPADRKPIRTHTAHDSDDIITQAITQELKRNGQTYVVAPRVRHIPSLVHRISQLIPQARIGAVHGQLPPRQLSQLMQQFYQGELNVLVTSTIIENGIDLPSANTIIVTKATHFGLSDLYQLRGRVGRRQHQGYAYFLYAQGKLTSDQKQRLAALTEASRLGSGWSIAQRDLEIRGAGNLLGAEQSGSVNTVGVQLYLDLVHESIDRQSKPATDRRDVNISLPITAHLPTHYIADSHSRTNAYQRLSRASDLPQLNRQIKQLTTQYGPPSPATQNLFALLKLQHLAAAADITDITSTTISPPDEDPFIRLTVLAKNLPATLKQLEPMGQWEIKDDTIIREFDTINLQVLNTLIQTLS